MILSKVKVIAQGSNRTRLINKLKDENIVIYNLISSDITTFWIKQSDIKVTEQLAESYGVNLELAESIGLAK